MLILRTHDAFIITHFIITHSLVACCLLLVTASLSLLGFRCQFSCQFCQLHSLLSPLPLCRLSLLLLLDVARYVSCCYVYGIIYYLLIPETRHSEEKNCIDAYSLTEQYIYIY